LWISFSLLRGCFGLKTPWIIAAKSFKVVVFARVPAARQTKTACKIFWKVN